MARTFVSCLIIAFSSYLLGGPPRGPLADGAAELRAAGTLVRTDRIVLLGYGLSDLDLISVTASLAASGAESTLLLDSADAAPHMKVFLSRYQPQRVVPLGSACPQRKELESRLGVAIEPEFAWRDGPPLPLWRALFPSVPRVVVCPAEPRRTLLQMACLAGVSKAPLYVLRGEAGETAKLRHQLRAWGTVEVVAAGNAIHRCQGISGVRVIPLHGEQDVSDYYLYLQLQNGPIRTLVVANPADGRAGMSALAPWIALQKRAALLLTNAAGSNTAALVQRALKRPSLRHVESLLLVADLKAIPPERRPNPFPGKDAFIEMEPLTPTGSEPFSFATGRLFDKDRSLVLLTLARQRLPTAKNRPLKALVVSNPAGGLPLLETFSRNTVQELRNRGYETASLFGDHVTKGDVRRLLPEQDIFLWEGHHSTMTHDYGLPGWPEPLEPSLVFLQSCLALCEPEALPLIERGAVGVIGTSTRTYSASGGACSLAFFDALLYENQTLGASLRQAKNFLLAYSLLKDKRLGPRAKLRGASLRSAWAFTLWGDPTLQLPEPESPLAARPGVRHAVHGNTIILFLPAQALDPVTVNPYHSEMLPNARLAGLLYKDRASSERRFAPLFFAEVHLPKAPHGKTPRLQSRLPANRYVFCWDSRRRCGYLLALPRAKDRGELHFLVHWDSGNATAAAAQSVVRVGASASGVASGERRCVSPPVGRAGRRHPPGYVE
jgi:hypothetical protein